MTRVLSPYGTSTRVGLIFYSLPGYLRKPNLLIPLSKLSSRGDQILNAKSFQSRGYSAVLLEEDLTSESLLKAIADLDSRRDDYIQNMNQSEEANAIGQIVALIREFRKTD
ncbi:MAG: glycosyltransferase [Pseudanabaena sp. ELA748]